MLRLCGGNFCISTQELCAYKLFLNHEGLFANLFSIIPQVAFWKDFKFNIIIGILLRLQKFKESRYFTRSVIHLSWSILNPTLPFNRFPLRVHLKQLFNKLKHRIHKFVGKCTDTSVTHYTLAIVNWGNHCSGTLSNSTCVKILFIHIA